MGSWRRQERARTPPRRMRVPKAIFGGLAHRFRIRAASIAVKDRLEGIEGTYQKSVEKRKARGLTEIDQAVQDGNNVVHAENKWV